MEYGKKVWIFADGDIPPRGDAEPYGHEALSVTNCGDSDADIRVSVLSRTGNQTPLPCTYRPDA